MFTICGKFPNCSKFSFAFLCDPGWNLLADISTKSYSSSKDDCTFWQFGNATVGCMFCAFISLIWLHVTPLDERIKPVAFAWCDDLLVVSHVLKLAVFDLIHSMLRDVALELKSLQFYVSQWRLRFSGLFGGCKPSHSLDKVSYKLLGFLRSFENGCVFLQ